MVIKKLINGFVVVQTNGLVSKEVFNEYIKESDIKNESYFINKVPGRMVNSGYETNSQQVGNYEQVDNDWYFHISFSDNLNQ